MNTDIKEETDPVNYPLFMGYLPSEFADKLEKELNETHATRKEKIQQVRKLIRNEKNISDEWFTDQDIIMYLRGRKYRVQDTFMAIKRMVAYVRKYEFLFEPFDPVVQEKCVEVGYPKVPPMRNEDGCVVMIGKLGVWDPSVVSFDDLGKFVVRVSLHLMSEPMTQVNGIIVLLDFKDCLSWRYLPYLNPSKMKMYYNFAMECAPVRLKAVHGVNPNVVGKLFLRLSLSVMPQKLRERLHVHNKPTDVADFVQSDVIPIEYGGNLLPHQMKNEWASTISLPNYIKSILKSTKH